jgi:hypothetical protein
VVTKLNTGRKVNHFGLQRFEQGSMKIAQWACRHHSTTHDRQQTFR